MNDEPGLSHNAALKIGLRNLLFRSKAGPAWAFSAEAMEVMHELWSDISQVVDEPNRRPPDGLDVLAVREVEGYLVRIICFPHPEELAENYFAAVAFRPASRAFLFWKRVPATLRYLALENSFTIPDREPKTVLGEWTADSHLNYGDGPEPMVERFAEAVRPILARG